MKQQSNKNMGKEKLGSTPLNKERRKSLIGAGAAAGAAAVWHKPIMNNVVLPAHAQMTNPMSFSLTTTADQVFPQGFNVQQYFPQLSSAFEQQGKSIFAKVIDIIIPPAMAGFESSSENFLAFYLAPDGTDTYTLQMYGEGPYTSYRDKEPTTYPDCIISVLFQADGLTVGGSRPAAGTSCIGFPGSGFSMTLNSVSEDGTTASITLDGGPTIELMADSAASSFSIVPCSCVFDIDNTLSTIAD